jgi:hypothetical protein
MTPRFQPEGVRHGEAQSSASERTITGENGSTCPVAGCRAVLTGAQGGATMRLSAQMD